jgi:hypothetical protein
VISFHQVSPPKPCIRLSSPPYAPHAPPSSFFSIWLPEHYVVRSTYHNAPHYVVFSTPVTFSVLGPNILLNTPFSNTLSLYSSPNVDDQVSQPCNTTGNLSPLIFWWQTGWQNILHRKAFPGFNLLLISSRIEFWFVKVVPKYSSTLSKELFNSLYTVTSSYILISRHDHVLSVISIYF